MNLIKYNYAVGDKLPKHIYIKKNFEYDTSFQYGYYDFISYRSEPVEILDGIMGCYDGSLCLRLKSFDFINLYYYMYIDNESELTEEEYMEKQELMMNYTMEHESETMWEISANITKVDHTGSVTYSTTGEMNDYQNKNLFTISDYNDEFILVDYSNCDLDLFISQVNTMNTRQDHLVYYIEDEEPTEPETPAPVIEMKSTYSSIADTIRSLSGTEDTVNMSDLPKILPKLIDGTYTGKDSLND